LKHLSLNPYAYTEQAESVRSCIDKLLQEKRGLTQVKKQELGL